MKLPTINSKDFQTQELLLQDYRKADKQINKYWNYVQKIDSPFSLYPFIAIKSNNILNGIRTAQQLLLCDIPNPIISILIPQTLMDQIYYDNYYINALLDENKLYGMSLHIVPVPVKTAYIILVENKTDICTGLCVI